MLPTEDDFSHRTTARVTATAERMSENVAALTRELQSILAGTIIDLQGDQVIQDLLRASIEGNLETVSQVARYDVPTADIQAPPAAVEYARRLAQRGVSATALLRAYRLGQENALAWSLQLIAAEETDPNVAYTAGQMFTSLTFRYIDAVSEQVLEVYEAERERWLANRNTVRAAILADLLDGTAPDVGAAEAALGYRLRQHHVGVVLWRPDELADWALTARRLGPHRPPTGPSTPTDWGELETGELRDLERVLARLARSLGTTAQPLFAAQDRATAWGWIPLGVRAELPTALGHLGDLESDGVRIALGLPAAGPEGFRRSHLDALRAQSVATVAAERAPMVTSYGEAEVRAAALLAGDLDSTRQLVASALSGLAEDSEGAERLRETLRVFLSTRNSFAATSHLIHLHKNTVKYRVDRAVALRGRGVDEDRLDLELALIACRWLGAAVLPGRGIATVHDVPLSEDPS